MLGSAIMANLRLIDGCPVSTPPDDLCLYHCVSFARDPEAYLSVPRTELGHFTGPGAPHMSQVARSIRDEVVLQHRVFHGSSLVFYHGVLIPWNVMQCRALSMYSMV